MTTFQDMKVHDEKWAAFRTDPDWVRMRGMEEYKKYNIKDHSIPSLPDRLLRLLAAHLLRGEIPPGGRGGVISCL